MSEQDSGQAVSTLQRPSTSNRDEWIAYWKQQGQSWRTEPEIDNARQKYLAERRAVRPDVEKGTYAFKDIELTRADVEWLLATHENGRGPVDWSDESQRGREGLDLRGADLWGKDLSYLPLACLNGGLDMMDWIQATKEQRKALAIHLEKSNLCGTYLQGANLCLTHLEEAELNRAHLERATLKSCHLEDARLFETNLESSDLEISHLENASLTHANLKNANLDGVNMEGAILCEVHLEGANLRVASMKGAKILNVHLEGTNLNYAHLEGAALRGSHMAGANLSEAYLDSATQLNDITLYTIASYLAHP